MIFYRFGEIPKNEKSCIWKGEEKVGEELGVSVYEAHKNINGLYSPVLPMPTNTSALDTFLYLIRYYSGKKYLVPDEDIASKLTEVLNEESGCGWQLVQWNLIPTTMLMTSLTTPCFGTIMILATLKKEKGYED